MTDSNVTGTDMTHVTDADMTDVEMTGAAAVRGEY
jgi:hypothetical protein